MRMTQDRENGVHTGMADDQVRSLVLLLQRRLESPDFDEHAALLSTRPGVSSLRESASVKVRVAALDDAWSFEVDGD